MPSLLPFLKWWLLVTALGWMTWPLAARVFRRLPDRGLSLSRALGLLLGGYVFWLLGSLGFLRNNVGGLLVAGLAVGGASLWAALAREGDRVDGTGGMGTGGMGMGWHGDATPTGGRAALRDWLREHWRTALAMEVVFLAAFALWAVVRAYNPQLQSAGGEKWMEYAFLNAINLSPTLPPHDPWLAGYAISYYYFGYVMMVALSKLTLTPLAVGFNLGIALLFALTALGVYGLTFNLMGLARPGEPRRWLLPAALGVVLLLGIGNYEALVEAGKSQGWLGAGVVRWLDIHDLDQQIPTGSATPGDGYWWWRASRTINDRDPSSGGHVEVIDEFPFFSFMLGDMHPHVLALPFAFLALGLALSFLLRPGPTSPAWGHWPLSPGRFILAAVVLGGLSFLNTWDFPIYLFVATAAYLLGRAGEAGWSREVWLDGATLGAGLAAAGVALYLPFYVGFQSQAGGILPNISFPTRLPQFLLMFGPLLILLALALGVLAYRERAGLNGRLFAAIALGTGPALFALSLLLGGLLMLFPSVRQALGAVIAPLSGGEALRVSLTRRLAGMGVSLLLGAMLGAAAVLGPGRGRAAHNGTRGGAQQAGRPPQQAVLFALIMLFSGTLLAIGPEYFYLRDQFGTRMNTVFKFYYQTWVLWSAAAAFLLWWVFGQMGRRARPATVAVATLAIGLGLVYPALALPAKTNNFRPNPGPTLDSTAEFARYNPEDYAAILWIQANLKDAGVIAEAVGGSYSGYGRISAFTGHPTVLGWPGHEGQWRGGYTEVGAREAEIEQLYRERDWARALPILEKYGVRYVYVGPMERGRYNPVATEKFDRFMRVIYRDGPVTIYER